MERFSALRRPNITPAYRMTPLRRVNIRRLRRGAHVGLYDLDQGHARAVQVDVTFSLESENLGMLLPASSSMCRRVIPIRFVFPPILILMKPCSSEAACRTARSGSLGQVRIKIFCARRWKVSLRRRVSAIAARTAKSYVFLFSTGKAPGSQGRPADIMLSEARRIGRAAAEDLRSGEHCSGFESNDGLVVRHGGCRIFQRGGHDRRL